jgi:phytoene desaturase
VKKRIVVIGSGFGGLGAAARLAASGHQVTLVEQLDKLGGRGYVFEQDGFKFDAGPTIITAPWMFDDIWAKAGKRARGLRRVRQVRPVLPDLRPRARPVRLQRRRDVHPERDRQAQPGRQARLPELRAHGQAIFDKGFVELADKPFHASPTCCGRPRPDPPAVVQERLRLVSNYVQDPFLRQVFSFHPLLVGGNPFDTTSIYAMIHYLEREWGVWYAMGGTGKLVEAFGG